MTASAAPPVELETLVALDAALEVVAAVEDAGAGAAAAVVAAEVLGGVLEALVEPLVHPATNAADPPISSARREVVTAGKLVGTASGEGWWLNERLQVY